MIAQVKIESMDIQIVTLENSMSHCDAAIVIDVCRAFTTAAFTFNAGAAAVIMTDTVENALRLKAAHPGSLVMGEVGGQRVPGFDLWNSPSEIYKLDLSGKIIIQRTSSGTQGMVLYQDKVPLLAGSFVVAGATLKFLQTTCPETLALVATGVRNGVGGSEDIALAEYLSERLRGRQVSPNPYLKKASSWVGSANEQDHETARILQSDLALCLDIDRFNFALLVEKVNSQLILKAVNPDGSPADIK